MSITLIAAMDRNHVIGSGNRLPWRLPAEMALFKQHTLGKTVLMGRKTFESLPKPLIDRRNVVLTRQADYKREGCELIHSMEDALKLAYNEELMVIGGADIYLQFLAHADKMYVSLIETEVQDGDAFFPVWDEEDWDLTDSKHRECDEKNAYSFTFQTLERRNR
jgi:dihydrofolate reductase